VENGEVREMLCGGFSNQKTSGKCGSTILFYQLQELPDANHVRAPKMYHSSHRLTINLLYSIILLLK